MLSKSRGRLGSSQPRPPLFYHFSVYYRASFYWWKPRIGWNSVYKPFILLKYLKKFLRHKILMKKVFKISETLFAVNLFLLFPEVRNYSHKVSQWDNQNTGFALSCPFKQQIRSEDMLQLAHLQSQLCNNLHYFCHHLQTTSSLSD